jgi:D-arabinose 1-dehydrogenase-like Zn-dependent alcohol dehydrogenase
MLEIATVFEKKLCLTLDFCCIYHSHFCGVPEGEIKIQMTPIIFGRLSISGNPVGGKTDTQAMLDFCAANDIKPIIEEFPHSQASEAIKKVRDGTIRFRAVLKNDLVNDDASVDSK